MLWITQSKNRFNNSVCGSKQARPQMEKAESPHSSWLQINIYTVFQQWKQSRDSPRQTCAHRRISGKCRTFTFLILKSGVVETHHERGFVESPARSAFRVPVGDYRRLKAQMLIQWHFLRATPGMHQCCCFCSRPMMENIQNEDK